MHPFISSFKKNNMAFLTSALRDSHASRTNKYNNHKTCQPRRFSSEEESKKPSRTHLQINTQLQSAQLFRSRIELIDNYLRCSGKHVHPTWVAQHAPALVPSPAEKLPLFSSTRAEIKPRVRFGRKFGRGVGGAAEGEGLLRKSC